MIDIHTHIIPEVDDGSKSVEESVKLLEKLERQGVDKVALTPHYYGRNKNITKFLGNRRAGYEKLRQAYTGKIRLVEGCECNISTCANGDFTDLEALTLGNTRYILTEMSFESEWDNEMWSRLNKLLDTGLVPVIAHVELYPAVNKKPQIAYRLVRFGCLLQINCDSVIDKTKYELVKALIRHGQAYCLGSDTHNLDKRPPHYAEAVQTLKTDFGTELIERMQENMENILSDKPVKTLPTTPINRTFFGKLK